MNLQSGRREAYREFGLTGEIGMRRAFGFTLPWGPLAILLAASNMAVASSSEMGAEGPPGPQGSPPQVAIDACAKLSDGASCSFTGKRGETLGGSCHAAPQQSVLACVPAHAPMQPPSDDAGPSRGY
jgi:hypothetical protein